MSSPLDVRTLTSVPANAMVHTPPERCIRTGCVAVAAASGAGGRARRSATRDATVCRQSRADSGPATDAGRGTRAYPPAASSVAGGNVSTVAASDGQAGCAARCASVAAVSTSMRRVDSDCWLRRWSRNDSSASVAPPRSPARSLQNASDLRLAAMPVAYPAARHAASEASISAVASGGLLRRVTQARIADAHTAVRVAPTASASVAARSIMASAASTSPASARSCACASSNSSAGGASPARRAIAAASA